MESADTKPLVVSVKQEHVSCCANKCPNCVSWGQNGLVAIGACNTIVICKSYNADGHEKYQAISQTLNVHKGRVNCVKWAQKVNDESNVACPQSYLISGSSDCDLICWKVDHTGDVVEVKDVLKSHKTPVTVVDSIIYGRTELSMLIVSAGSDSTVTIWKSSLPLSADNVSLSQTLDFGNALILSVAVHVLPCGTPIIACGRDNADISLYVLTRNFTLSREDFGLVSILSGHTGWIRGLDFHYSDGIKNECILASCSQDSFIRLWKIKLKTPDDYGADENVLKPIENSFLINKDDQECKYAVQLEAVLAGHEGWVYSVQWMKKDNSNNVDSNNSRLLSASMDKSIIIWGTDETTGLWVEIVRFGELGGNTLGFYGAQFNYCGSEILAHSFNGALHFWKEFDNGESGTSWKPGVTVSGHSGPVLDLCWEPKQGRYLLTTSMDQTTRLIAQWVTKSHKSWHEVARPQIHGYDMKCLSMIDSLKFISGADEKVLRVFEASKTLLATLKSVSCCDVGDMDMAPESAVVPALGLSNKAVYGQKEVTNGGRIENSSESKISSVKLSRPPTEEYLLQNTLWPETHKLYHHVYELFCVSSNADGTLVATAAKASKPEHAEIALWCTKSWKKISLLKGHTLTVTDMKFSTDGKFLLSVSRDRTWVLHRIQCGSECSYQANLFARSDKRTCHNRIIWSCSWSHDNKIFCTSSRDKKIMFWKVNYVTESDEFVNREELVSRVAVKDTEESVTAVAFAVDFLRTYKYILCVGKQSGCLELYSFNCDSSKCELMQVLCRDLSHSLAVKRLQWRPNNEEGFCLASCGDDHMVKMFTVKVQ